MDEDDFGIDAEVQEAIADEKRLARGRGRQESKMRRLVRKIQAAIDCCDSGALTRALREANVTEGSEPWKNAWKAFHDVCGRS